MSQVINIHDLAKVLSAAGDRLSAPDLPVPATVTEAMAVQKASYEPAPAGPVGYKVACSPDGIAVIGRLLPLAIETDPVPALPWRKGARIEVEIAVRFATALPPRQGGYSRDEVKAAIGSVHLGIEILDSRIAEGSKAPYLLFLADRIGNAGYALGPELPNDMLETVGGNPLEVLLEGSSIHAADARHPADDAMAWLMDWANDSTRPLDTLSAGEIITTGSLCGALDISGPGLLRTRLAETWEMSLILEDRLRGD
ncbi:hydratase [Rhizobium sp. CG5]|uniref:hydratase n=1 Tax=Rhizobium sp. CG5 TaxID=2726076 RepID=UPI0020348F88|nr:hydratase [Rhizobium sp. CG5]MCM2474582.1 hydratase [Rhizobium sp. CG5]